MVTPVDPARRARARLLLALCTLALGIGLGIVVALPATRARSIDPFAVTAPGDATRRLEPGRYTFAVARSSELPLEESRPVCTTVRLGPGDAVTPVDVIPESDDGFAAMRIPIAGDHRIACSATLDGVGIVVSRRTTTSPAGALVRAGLVTLGLTALAVLLAARPLLYLRSRRMA